MKEKRKWTPHIIAVTAIVVFCFLSLACASSPKQPDEIVYDSNIPSDQLATLYIPHGSIDVIQFNGDPLTPRWFQMNAASRGMDVKIPAGKHNIVFNYYGGAYGVTMKDVKLDFNAVAGRTYSLTFVLTDYDSNSVTGRVTEKVFFTILETSEMREPGPDEQVFSITKNKSFGLVVLDMGTVDERRISPIGPRARSTTNGNIRVIIPKGEHTIDVLPHPPESRYSLEPAEGQQGNFTASSEPVLFSIVIGKITGRVPDAKATYTLTRE